MKRYLYFDSEKCSACGACALACMDQNDIDIPAGEQPFRHTFTLEGKTGDLHFYSVSCMHCADAPCVMGCPCGYQGPGVRIHALRYHQLYWLPFLCNGMPLRGSGLWP